MLEPQLQPQYQHSNIGEISAQLRVAWNQYPSAERGIIKGVLWALVLAFIPYAGESLGVTVLIATALHYVGIAKPRQDRQVNQYNTLVAQNGGETYFRNVNDHNTALQIVQSIGSEEAIKMATSVRWWPLNPAVKYAIDTLKMAPGSLRVFAKYVVATYYLTRGAILAAQKLRNELATQQLREREEAAAKALIDEVEQERSRASALIVEKARIAAIKNRTDTIDVIATLNQILAEVEKIDEVRTCLNQAIDQVVEKAAVQARLNQIHDQVVAIENIEQENLENNAIIEAEKKWELKNKEFLFNIYQNMINAIQANHPKLSLTFFQGKETLETVLDKVKINPFSDAAHCLTVAEMIVKFNRYQNKNDINLDPTTLNFLHKHKETLLRVIKKQDLPVYQEINLRYLGEGSINRTDEGNRHINCSML